MVLLGPRLAVLLRHVVRLLIALLIEMAQEAVILTLLSKCRAAIQDVVLNINVPGGILVFWLSNHDCVTDRYPVVGFSPFRIKCQELVVESGISFR